MPDIEYDSINMTDEETREVFLKVLNANKILDWPSVSWSFQNFPATLSAVNDVAEDENLVWNIWKMSDTHFNTRYYNSGYLYVSRVKQGFKMTVNSGKRACIVRAKARVQARSNGVIQTTDALIDMWMVIGKDSSSITLTSRHTQYGDGEEAYPTPMRQEIQWDGSGQISAGTPSVSGNPIKNFNNNLVDSTSALRTRSNDVALNNLNLKSTHLAKLTAIRAHNSHYGWSWNGSDITTSGQPMSGGFPQITGDYSVAYVFRPEQFPADMPVFDLNNCSAAGIWNYLDNGDDSEKEPDPFDPGNPVNPVVNSMNTDFKVFLDKKYELAGSTFGQRKVIVNCYNEGFNRNRDLLSDYFRLHVILGYYDGTNLTTTDYYDSSQNPQLWFPIFPDDLGDSPSNRYYLIYCRFECLDSSYLGANAHSNSGLFEVKLKYDGSSKYGVKIDSCRYAYPGESTYTSLSKIVGSDSVEDYTTGGTYTRTYYKYPYTRSGMISYNENLFFYWGGITVEDISYPTDDDYKDKDDVEDETTGSDRTISIGNGMYTYCLTAGGAQDLNDFLWNDLPTGWENVSIDPVKCIISSSQIPFVNTGTSIGGVYVANKFCETSGSWTVNPMKSYNCGTVTIPAINGNFTDITMTTIHLYLPYIGWQEIPASEVICRQSYLAQGVSSKTHRLSFKYLVDFVDGECRCIVSVDGTERWYFDGHCGIDMPFTSDNHAAAIANARKSAVGGALKVAGGLFAVGVGVAGIAVSGGASASAIVGGVSAIGGGVATAASTAVSDFPNAIPKYDYSASCSPSGVIESGMNNYIMVVVESPNAWYPSGYGHRIGYPCEQTLSLGSCSGFTKTRNIDVSGINCTETERAMIKELLDGGVYL